jgi:hypothetical protein
MEERLDEDEEKLLQEIQEKRLKLAQQLEEMYHDPKEALKKLQDLKNKEGLDDAFTFFEKNPTAFGKVKGSRFTEKGRETRKKVKEAKLKVRGLAQGIEQDSSDFGYIKSGRQEIITRYGNKEERQQSMDDRIQKRLEDRKKRRKKRSLDNDFER